MGVAEGIRDVIRMRIEILVHDEITCDLTQIDDMLPFPQ
jgi:hypothetical protein